MFLASQKVYVVNSPSLISQINRRQRIIDSNPPFLTLVFGKLFGFASEDLAELFRDHTENSSLRRDSKVLEHSMLERGMGPLHEIFNKVMSKVADRLTTVASESPVTLNLEAWLQEIFTLSTADGVFGPRNPFARNPDLLENFW